MSERRTDEIESGSWRTPQAGDGTHNHCDAPAHKRGTVPLMLSVQALREVEREQAQNWVTPQARDGEQRGVQSMRERVAQGHSMSLPEQMADQVQTWPTPAAMNPNDGEGVETWLARRERLKQTQQNGNGCGTPLSIAVQLSGSAWPTPTATDAKASGAAGYSTESGRHSGTTLTDATVGPRGPESRSTTGKSRARLNHRWVAQLMGFPSDWLEGIDVPPSKPSATASSRKSSKPSDEQSEV